jgi:hypothetical protein
MLFDHVANVRPPWSTLATRGRAEAVRFAPEGVQQSLREAGLLDIEASIDAVEWWDRLAARIRSLKHDHNTEVARKAEALTIATEERRTGVRPRWVAIDSNLSGFDVESRIDRGALETLRIEVKGSENSLDVALAYITRNEWDVANSPGSHCFHLWVLGKQPRFAVLSVADVSPHIPHDKGNGQWRECSIHFGSFLGHFVSP